MATISLPADVVSWLLRELRPLSPAAASVVEELGNIAIRRNKPLPYGSLMYSMRFLVSQVPIIERDHAGTRNTEEQHITHSKRKTARAELVCT